MHIEYLEAHFFRNLKPLSINVSAPSVMILGANGQGKSNLLECLYLCATGRSFRHVPMSSMIQHGAQQALVKASFFRQTIRHRIEVRLSNHHRSIELDDKKLKHLVQLLDCLNVVSFFPDDLKIIKGAPEERRRFIDRALAHTDKAFVEATLAYHRVLKTRNNLLKQEAPLDKTLFETYNEALVCYGSRMYACRYLFLQSIEQAVASNFRQMMSDAFELKMVLSTGLQTPVFFVPNPSWSMGDHLARTFLEALYADAFRKDLQQYQARDKARKQTLSGPHRSDIHLYQNDKEARLYASQGQQRAMVLAFKMAEVAYVHQRLQTPPILLLDDVSSELDPQRCRLFFQGVQALGCQLWLSSTGAAHLPIEGPQQILRINDGAWQQETSLAFSGAVGFQS